MPQVGAPRWIGFTLLFAGGEAGAANEVRRFNLDPGVTDTSQRIFQLHSTVLFICLLIGLTVFSLIAYTLWKYRLSRGVRPARFRGSHTIELIWTLIPLAILVVISIPATQTLLAMNRDVETELTVEVRASQWKWHYAYADSNVAFYSNLRESSRRASTRNETPQQVDYFLRDVDRPLVLPVGRPIRLHITADDVIHSWWVPAFGIKRDAVPGYINRVHLTIQEPGLYRGQCAELCGTGHAYMPIVVEALPAEEFDAWLAQAEGKKVEAQQAAAELPWTLENAIAHGEKVFNTVCAACHQQSGEGVPGAFPPLKGSAVATGPLPPHLDIVIHGSKRNLVMRAWGEMFDNRDLAAVITYERNAWGNDTGDLITTEQVEAAR